MQVETTAKNFSKISPSSSRPQLHHHSLHLFHSHISHIRDNTVGKLDTISKRQLHRLPVSCSFRYDGGWTQFCQLINIELVPANSIVPVDHHGVSYIRFLVCGPRTKKSIRCPFQIRDRTGTRHKNQTIVASEAAKLQSVEKSGGQNCYWLNIRRRKERKM
jgi:hypothetical protein